MRRRCVNESYQSIERMTEIRYKEIVQPNACRWLDMSFSGDDQCKLLWLYINQTENCNMHIKLHSYTDCGGLMNLRFAYISHNLL